MKYQFDFEKPNKTPRTTKVAEDKQLVQKKIEELLEEAKVETLKMKNDFNMIGKKRKLSLNQIDGDFDKVCKAILFSPSSSQCKFDDLINKEKSIKAKIDEIEEKLSKVDNSIKENLFSKKSTCYNIVPIAMKKLISKAASYFSKKDLFRMFNISTKSIRRWEKDGVSKKKGAGRKKMDPLMEKKLLDWYHKEKDKGVEMTSRMIKEKAKLLSRNKKFKASKGWFSKFRKNYNIVTVISYEKRKKDNIN